MKYATGTEAIEYMADEPPVDMAETESPHVSCLHGWSPWEQCMGCDRDYCTMCKVPRPPAGCTSGGRCRLEAEVEAASPYHTISSHATGSVQSSPVSPDYSPVPASPPYQPSHAQISAFLEGMRSFPVFSAEDWIFYANGGHAPLDEEERELYRTALNLRQATRELDLGPELNSRLHSLFAAQEDERAERLHQDAIPLALHLASGRRIPLWCAHALLVSDQVPYECPKLKRHRHRCGDMEGLSPPPLQWGYPLAERAGAFFDVFTWWASGLRAGRVHLPASARAQVA